MSPSSFLITISGTLLLVAYGLYATAIFVGPSKIGVEKLLLPSTVIQSCAGAIAILLEREFRRAYGTEQQNTVQHLAVATILTASSAGAIVFNNIMLFEHARSLWLILNCAIYVISLLVALAQATIQKTKFLLRHTQMPQEHTNQVFTRGERIRQYRSFVASTWFFTCCPCIVTYGFVEFAYANEWTDSHMYEVQAVDVPNRRLLLSRVILERTADGGRRERVARAMWVGPETFPNYYRVFKDVEGPQYHYDCFRKIAPIEFAPRAPPTPDMHRSNTPTNPTNARFVTIHNGRAGNDPLVTPPRTDSMSVYGSMQTPSLNDSLITPSGRSPVVGQSLHTPPIHSGLEGHIGGNRSISSLSSASHYSRSISQSNNQYNEPFIGRSD